MIDRSNFYLEIRFLVVHLLFKSPIIEVFDYFSVVNTERPGSDALSKNHSVWTLALRSNMMEIMKTELCKGYPVYRIVPSVHPVPG